jgi:hypothetical protein
MWEFLRKDLTLILAVVAVVLSLSYAIGYVSETKPEAIELEAHFSGERAPKPQTIAERVWKEPVLEKLAAVDPAAVKEPMIMQVDKSGLPYLFDWSDFKVKQFSLDGKLQKTFGDETGQDQFVNPTAFTVDANGSVWVADPQQQRIKVFSNDGKVQTITPQNASYRVAIAPNMLFTMAAPGKNNLFEIYDLTGRQLRSFGELLADQPEKGIILDGNIVSDENQGFNYGARYMGVLGSYDTDGNQRFFVQTIDGVPQSSLLDIAGKKRIKPDTAPSILTMSIVGNELYVLSGARFDGKTGSGGQVIDVYDKLEGWYLFSFKLPIVCKAAIVRSDYLYTLSKGQLTVWRFKQNA